MKKVLLALTLLSSIVFASGAMADSNQHSAHGVQAATFGAYSFGFNYQSGSGHKFMTFIMKKVRIFKKRFKTRRSQRAFGGNGPHPGSNGNPGGSTSVPEMDATGGIIAFALLAGLIGLVRERKLNAR